MGYTQAAVEAAKARRKVEAEAMTNQALADALTDDRTPAVLLSACIIEAARRLRAPAESSGSALFRRLFGLPVVLSEAVPPGVVAVVTEHRDGTITGPLICERCGGIETHGWHGVNPNGIAHCGPPALVDGEDQT